MNRPEFDENDFAMLMACVGFALSMILFLGISFCLACVAAIWYAVSIGIECALWCLEFVISFWRRVWK